MKLIILGTLFGLAMVLVNGKFNIYHWNHRTVPYFFHGSVSNNNKNMVRSTKVTMTHWGVKVHPKNETIIRGGVMYMLFKVLVP